MKKRIDLILSLVFITVVSITISTVTATDISATDTIYYLNEEIGMCYCVEGIQGVSYCCSRTTSTTTCELNSQGVPVVPDKNCYWEGHIGESNKKCGESAVVPQN